MKVSEKDLDFWIKNDMNILLEGRHGIGKTSMIIDAFKRNNVSYRVFSAATLDPWVDFVGVPKEKIDENGISYLELVQQRDFATGGVEFIFLDEYNRAPPKVKNATMELIQFKSINGKPIPKLRAVWAAINPFDEVEDEYDVERMDAAQMDRFHVYVDLPYECERQFFTKKYGSEKATAAIRWWNNLSPKEKKVISPRRLDTALNYLSLGGNLKHVIPKTINSTYLARLLTEKKYTNKELLSAFQNREKEAITYIKNKYGNEGEKFVKELIKFDEAFIPHITDTLGLDIISDKSFIQEFPSVRRHMANDSRYKEVIETHKKFYPDDFPEFSGIVKETKVFQLNLPQKRGIPETSFETKLHNIANANQTPHRVLYMRSCILSMKNCNEEQFLEMFEAVNKCMNRTRLKTLEKNKFKYLPDTYSFIRIFETYKNFTEWANFKFGDQFESDKWKTFLNIDSEGQICGEDF